MGFFSSISRNYRNAGAQVTVFLYFSGDDDPSALRKEPLFDFRCTGLELHNWAREAKSGLLKVLNEDPSKYRGKIELPRDYWRLAMRTVVNDMNKGFPRETSSLVRDALCLTIEGAFTEFTSGDICSVFVSRDAHVRVERQQTESPYDLFRQALGPIQVAA
jgi:hypothetical protein